MTHNIAPPLVALAVPVENLTELPGNPRKGDIKAIARSLKVFGQRKPITARQTSTDENGTPVGLATAGNHTLLAARDELGWSHIAVAWFDEDETTAKAWALADNRLSEIGTNDADLLATMLGEVAADHDLFEATAYTDEDLQALLDTGLAAPGDAEVEDYPIQWGVVVEVDTEAEQIDLLRRLQSEGRRVRAIM